MRNLRAFAYAAALLPIVATMLFVSAQSSEAKPGKSKDVIVIGHRGASGYRPEHTLAAYELAIMQGADFIEPDLVSTKDGVLVARHENEIGGTTDVAAKFPGRLTTKTIDGVAVTGYFTEDFTLAELKTLRAKERLPALRSTAYDGLYEVPTLQEVIDLVQDYSRGRGTKAIGIYPETKHPTYFDGIGLSLEEPLVEALHGNGYNGNDKRVFIQSFEVANLKDLNSMTKLPLVQLINSTGAPYDFVAGGDARTYADMTTPAGLADISGYAEGIGANKDLIIPRDVSGALLEPTTLIDDAHKADLIVHAWTFRAENTFLPLDFRSSENPAEQGDLKGEIQLFLSLGLDGFFTDFPDIGVEAVQDFDDTDE
jgi:glycerophosphoryl diester phosphodiesterase